MQKRAPSTAQIALMVVFALSCFGLLTYIWKSFGGPSPLAPKGYRLQADFDEATQLSDTAEVRISGVPVGRVKKTRLAGDRTRVDIEIEARYAPVPRDTRAMLRQKTLLGETYVELTPGDRRSGNLPDGGRLPRGQVEATTELDEVTRALDTRTRRDLQRFVGAFAALEGDGEKLNNALGNLPRFATDTGALLRSLDRQRAAVRQLVRDSGEVFDALGRRQGELSGLVRAGERVLTATARRDRELAETVHILPTTLAELRPTLTQLRELSLEAGPLVRELRPGARALAPALIDVAALSPDLRALFGDVDRLVSVSETGVPATTNVVRAADPVFDILVPTLREAQPVTDYLGIYKTEIVAQLAGLAASLQAAAPGAPGGDPLHYIRVVTPFTTESPVASERRLGSNRHNPYPRPLWLRKLKTGLESFDCSHVGNPSFEPAPPCKVQRPIEFGGRRLQFPHVERGR